MSTVEERIAKLEESVALLVRYVADLRTAAGTSKLHWRRASRAEQPDGAGDREVLLKGEGDFLRTALYKALPEEARDRAVSKYQLQLEDVTQATFLFAKPETVKAIMDDKHDAIVWNREWVGDKGQKLFEVWEAVLVSHKTDAAPTPEDYKAFAAKLDEAVEKGARGNLAPPGSLKLHGGGRILLAYTFVKATKEAPTGESQTNTVE